jgi:hypothetical protein
MLRDQSLLWTEGIREWCVKWMPSGVLRTAGKESLSGGETGGVVIARACRVLWFAGGLGWIDSSSLWFAGGLGWIDSSSLWFPLASAGLH